MLELDEPDGLCARGTGQIRTAARLLAWLAATACPPGLHGDLRMLPRTGNVGPGFISCGCVSRHLHCLGALKQGQSLTNCVCPSSSDLSKFPVKNPRVFSYPSYSPGDRAGQTGAQSLSDGKKTQFSFRCLSCLLLDVVPPPVCKWRSHS